MSTFPFLINKKLNKITLASKYEIDWLIDLIPIESKSVMMTFSIFSQTSINPNIVSFYPKWMMYKSSDTWRNGERTLDSGETVIWTI